MSSSETQPEEEYSFKKYFLPLTTTKIIHFIIIIGILVFANSLLNPFIFDDIPQIVQNQQVQQLTSVPLFFMQAFAFPGAQAGDLLHIYFKPLLFSAYTIIYSLSGTSVFSFHLLQLIIHICNAIFVYIILKRFINNNISFLLSIIFLVHPLNSETVIYIANLQDVLFTFFGLIALMVIPQKNNNISLLRLSLISIALFFSLLSKETGIVFFLFVWLYTFFFNKKFLLRVTYFEIGAFLATLLLRYNASFHTTPIMSLSLIQHESLITRMLSIPKMIFYYLSHFVLPIHLATGQEWIVKILTFPDFYLPLLIDMLVFLLIFIGGVFIFRKQKNVFSIYLFFSFWFLIGLGMHLQFIALDVTVADRWFYFPMIGVLGVIGVVIEKYITFNKLQLGIAFSLVTLLCLTTFIRNAQWQTPLSLYSHDMQYAGQSPVMASYYGALLIDKGDYAGANKYLSQSVASNPTIGSNLINLAVLKEHQGNYVAAEALYNQNISQNESLNYALLSYHSLARLALINQHDPKKTKYIAKKGLQKYPADTLLTEYVAVADYLLGEKNEALLLSQKLYNSSPDTQTQKIYTLIKSDKLTLDALLNK